MDICGYMGIHGDTWDTFIHIYPHIITLYMLLATPHPISPRGYFDQVQGHEINTCLPSSSSRYTLLRTLPLQRYKIHPSEDSPIAEVQDTHF